MVLKLKCLFILVCSIVFCSNTVAQRNNIYNSFEEWRNVPSHKNDDYKSVLKDTISETSKVSYKHVDGVRLKDGEWLAFLKEKCTPAYYQFEKGSRLLKVGVILKIVGAFAIANGVFMDLESEYCAKHSDLVDIKDPMFTMSVVTIISGISAFFAGTPFIIDGTIRRGRSIAIYEEEQGKTTKNLEYTIGLRNGGIGMSVRF